MADDGLLRTYLQDHHAAATAGLELARRAAGSNSGDAYGAELERLAEEATEDRAELERAMSALEIGPSRLKDGAMWSAEKLGRLKPNNRLRGYSPLSRVIEMEGLAIAATASLTLWRALADLGDERLSGFDLARLAAAAADRRERAEGLHARAASEAFGA